VAAVEPQDARGWTDGVGGLRQQARLADPGGPVDEDDKRVGIGTARGGGDQVDLRSPTDEGPEGSLGETIGDGAQSRRPRPVWIRLRGADAERVPRGEWSHATYGPDGHLPSTRRRKPNPEAGFHVNRVAHAGFEPALPP